MWNAEYRSAFVRVVLAESQRLGRTDSGFKKTSWTRILTVFNREVDLSFSKPQLQSQLQQLKSKYGVYTDILHNSGFGVCPQTGRPTAPNDVWQAYVIKHPKAREFRDKPLPMYDELHEIFGSTTATGRCAASSVDGFTNDSQSDSDSQLSISARDDSTTDNASNTGTTTRSTSMRRLSTPPGTLSDSSEPRDSPPPAPSPAYTPSRSGYKRRRSSGKRISAALEKIANSHSRRVRHKSHSQTQIAISSFLLEFGVIMSPDDRIKYVHYFMSNQTAAEAFNVLDRTTKAAFISNLDLV